MSTLTRHAIVERLLSTNKDTRLIITPMMQEKQISDASVDLRVGHEFIVFNLSQITCIDPFRYECLSDREREIHKYQKRIRIGRQKHFVLHPKQFVLAATLEYIVLPTDLHAEVGGRSTWGRTGLVIATATTVAPGYHGCITLELANEGVVPLILHPGDVIAQLVLHEASPRATPYEGTYQYQTGPRFPDFKKPADILFWRKSHSKS